MTIARRVEASTSRVSKRIANTYWGDLIMNPLDTIQGTVIAGVVLAVILAFAAKAIAGA